MRNTKIIMKSRMKIMTKTSIGGAINAQTVKGNTIKRQQKTNLQISLGGKIVLVAKKFLKIKIKIPELF